MLVLSLVLVVSACSGDDGSVGSIAWSDDPCGLAPPQDVAAAFGVDAVAVAAAAPGECRYEIDGELLRLIVLADADTCEGTRRGFAAMGSQVVAPDGAPEGVFVTQPGGELIVCDAEVTYVLSGPGGVETLIRLVDVLPSDRAD